MNTKWKVILSVMLLIASICTVFVILVQQQHDEKVAGIIAGKGESAALLANTLLTEFSSNYQHRIMSFTDPSISPSREQMIRAFADRDRDKLLQLSKPFFAVFQKENPYFSTLAWILPDNHSFLAVHNPQKFGLDLSEIRPDIAAVNHDRQLFSGFDAGYAGLQYRIVQPVFYHDEYLGAVQFGIRASAIFDALQSKLKTLAGVAVLNQECAVVKESKIPKLTCNTHTIRSREVSVFEPIVDLLDWNSDKQMVVLNGRPNVILNVLPVNNFKNEKLGVFFVALDISEEVAQKRNLLISVLTISGVLLLLSFLILYSSYGALVQKIIDLNHSLEKNNIELEKRVYERTANLQESENRLQKILDQSPLGILIADTKSMQLRYANPALCTMLGYDKEELKNTEINLLHTPADFEQIEKDYKIYVKGEKHIPTVIRFLRKNGTILEADIISASLELEKRPCVVGFIVDQTEGKKLEKQLNRAQKMEAIGLMASGVAHDLNNILAGIISYPELLLLELPQSSELREPLEAIQASGKRAATVVADLLTVARGAASTREPHDINILIEEYLNSPECKKLKSLYTGVECVQQIDAEHSIIDCSPMHIKKTIMNLTTNAAEAVGEKGSILISTCNQFVNKLESDELHIDPGDYVVLNVQDNGPGIAARDLEHIFEPFYTRKVMGRSGTGIGLAVVWNTVQDHNGKIFVESSEQGTCFRLYFPVIQKDAALPEKVGDTTPTGNNEYILVVDDEPQLRDIASKILITLGYQTESVCSGELALKFLEEHQVDLIIIDMLMEPGMNGRQTYEKILAMYPDQKAIIASGFSESDEVKAALRLGVGGFIKKPYSRDQLGRVVGDVLAT
ncbi:MAG: response regulator [Proteobacteria bacterium]|nr:response regulator [Pseudomonadota bacterium]MBU1417051.1 response regulator [Pseudomonadota bacterium]MBU1453747.1 response regulator [Pseudomonadota bacterium]